MRMKESGIDRIPRTIFEKERSHNTSARRTTGDEISYYPNGMLDPEEQRLIKEEKPYVTISLVNDDVGGVRQYDHAGIEVQHRTPASTRFLAPLSHDSTYVTSTGLCTPEEFAKETMESKWTPETIETRVNKGIQEYNRITRRLVDNAGVYDTLEKMENRKETPFESVMQNMY